MGDKMNHERVHPHSLLLLEKKKCKLINLIYLYLIIDLKF